MFWLKIDYSCTQVRGQQVIISPEVDPRKWCKKILYSATLAQHHEDLARGISLYHFFRAFKELAPPTLWLLLLNDSSCCSHYDPLFLSSHIMWPYFYSNVAWRPCVLHGLLPQVVWVSDFYQFRNTIVQPERCQLNLSIHHNSGVLALISLSQILLTHLCTLLISITAFGSLIKAYMNSTFINQ